MVQAYKWADYFRENPHDRVIPLDMPDELMWRLDEIGRLPHDVILVLDKSDYGFVEHDVPNYYVMRKHYGGRKTIGGLIKFPSNVKKIYSINANVEPGYSSVCRLVHVVRNLYSMWRADMLDESEIYVM